MGKVETMDGQACINHNMDLYRTRNMAWVPDLGCPSGKQRHTNRVTENCHLRMDLNNLLTTEMENHELSEDA